MAALRPHHRCRLPAMRNASPHARDQAAAAQALHGQTRVLAVSELPENIRRELPQLRVAAR